MGNVGKPGEIAWRQGLTVANCVAAAGGALPTADLGHVFILRDGVRTRVNLRKILSGKAPDVIVQPGDRVFVQESAL
jgi:protein involved in polysaccharide export with SLBB domain